MDDKMQRLEVARKKAQEIARRKERLAGELDAKRKSVKALEDKAREEFDCTVEEIPGLVIKLNEEAESALAKAEALLAGTEG